MRRYIEKIRNEGTDEDKLTLAGFVAGLVFVLSVVVWSSTLPAQFRQIQETIGRIDIAQEAAVLSSLENGNAVSEKENINNENNNKEADKSFSALQPELIIIK